MKTKDSLPFIKQHIACPCGLSSDGYSMREDGSGYCFGQCGGKNFNAPKQEPDEEVLMEVSSPQDFKIAYYPHRGLTEHTYKFYDVQTKMIDNKPYEVGFPYDHRKGVKVRPFDIKKFRASGDMKRPGIFGLDKFDPGAKDAVCITAGEYDAMSVYQVTNGRFAGVSLPSATEMGMTAAIDNREKLNSFKKIYLALDRDEQDQELARRISRLFDFNKVYHVKFEKHKDANDYLQNLEGNDLLKIVENARRYSPDNIISQFGDIEAALSKSEEDIIGTYPWEQLNNMTFGIKKGETVVIKGLEKIGKTELLRAIAHHLLKTTSLNVGIVFLEEDNATTIKGLAGYELDLPAMLPTCHLTTDDIIKGYKSAVGGRDDRVFLYQSFEAEDEERFLDGLRFLGAGAGCSVILFDHISWLATGTDDQDERKKLDRISQKIKLLAKELGIAIIMISHVNDSGQTRGSRNITKVANTIIHVDRDKTSPDPFIRDTTFITLEGVRLGGQTGPAGSVMMDRATGKLKALDDQQRIPT